MSSTKPGYETTEFWLAILSNVVAIATAFDTHIQTSSQLLNALAVLLAALAPIMTSIFYTFFRTKLKIATITSTSHAVAAVQRQYPASPVQSLLQRIATSNTTQPVTTGSTETKESPSETVSSATEVPATSTDHA